MVEEIADRGCDTIVGYISVPSDVQNALINTINEGIIK